MMARPSLFTHPKFLRLSMLLGNRYKAVGVLEMIWNHAYQDGRDVLGSADVVEYMVDWDGEHGACVRALVETRFLDEVAADVFAVHDLLDHAPDYVRKRKTREEQRRTATGQRPASDRALTTTPAPAPAPAPAHGGEQKRKRFTPPTVDDVRVFSTEHDLHLDAQRFVDFYTSKGWKVGTSPMKDWKAAARNWARRDATDKAPRRVGVAPADQPWHPDDVAKHGQPGNEHPRWHEYMDAHEMAADWPRFEEWLK